MEFHLFDLPHDLYIDLEPNFRKRMFKKGLDRYGNLVNFTNELKESSRNVIRWKNGVRAISIRVLQRFTQLDITSEKKLEKNIVKIKKCGGYIKNPRLPLVLNEDLAKIIAATFCDGGITKDYAVHYTNKNLKHMNSFRDAVKKVFGDVHLIMYYRRKSTKVYHILYSGVMGCIIYNLFHVPKRSKIVIDAPISKSIMEADISIVRSFIKQCFDDEGWCSKDIGISRTIISAKLISNDGPLFLQDLKYLLENKFDIRVHGPRLVKVRSYFTNEKKIQVKDYALKICDRNSLEKFYKEIGFSLDYKMIALRRKLDSYKLWEVPNGESLHFFLRKGTSFILNRGKPFSVFDLVTLTDRTTSRINWAVSELKKIKLIKVTDYEKNRITGNRLPLYTLTSKGFNYVFNFGK